MSKYDSQIDIEDPMIPDTQKENPDEMIIIGDNNSPTWFYRGKRSDIQLLVNEGGDPWEFENPEVNEKGQVKSAVEWNDDTGKPTKFDWIDVHPVPDHWKTNAQTDEVLPREQRQYFRDMENKHFVPETAVGSLFTESPSLRSLIDLAIEQRGDLEGDDRDKFIAMGVKPEALMSFCRYLKVETPGEVGIVNVKDLEPDTKVKVIRTKQGAPCSLVVEKAELPLTDFGTIIIGPNEKSEDPKASDPSTKEMIWTVHPGLPVRPATEDIWPEGSEITVQEVIDKLGNDVFLNVKKVEVK